MTKKNLEIIVLNVGLSLLIFFTGIYNNKINYDSTVKIYVLISYVILLISYVLVFIKRGEKNL